MAFSWRCAKWTNRSVRFGTSSGIPNPWEPNWPRLALTFLLVLSLATWLERCGHGSMVCKKRTWGICCSSVFVFVNLNVNNRLRSKRITADTHIEQWTIVVSWCNFSTAAEEWWKWKTLKYSNYTQKLSNINGNSTSTVLGENRIRPDSLFVWAWSMCIWVQRVQIDQETCRITL